MEKKKFIFCMLLAIASSNYGMQQKPTQAIINICNEQQKKIQEKINKPSKEDQSILKNTQDWWQQVIKNIRNESIEDDFVYETTSIYILATLGRIRDNKIVCDQTIANELKELLSDEHKPIITSVDKTTNQNNSSHKVITSFAEKEHQKATHHTANQKLSPYKKSPYYSSKNKGQYYKSSKHTIFSSQASFVAPKQKIERTELEQIAHDND